VATRSVGFAVCRRGSNALEIFATHVPVAVVSVEALQAALRCLLARVKVLAARFAVVDEAISACVAQEMRLLTL
jgi:hypothetical protein